MAASIYFMIIGSFFVLFRIAFFSISRTSLFYSGILLLFVLVSLFYVGDASQMSSDLWLFVHI